LIVLAIFGTVISAIVLLRNQTQQGKVLVTTPQSNFLTSSHNDDSTTTEITSMFLSCVEFRYTLFTLDTCFMTFKYPSERYPTGLNPSSMVTGDFNTDSIVDIVVTNYDSDTLSVMLGNGDGTFQTAHILSTGNGSCPKEVKIADFNNDAMLDLGTWLFRRVIKAFFVIFFEML
jgi:hypothetical protein